MQVTSLPRLWPHLAANVAAVVALLVISSPANATSRQNVQSTTVTLTSRSTIPMNTRLTSVAFLNPSRGYGVFNVFGKSTCSDRVGRTTNGGATFSTPRNVVSWPCSAAVPANALAFDDHGDGFFYGPSLYVTHDNGDSWSRSPQPGTVLSVEALGPSIWMLETAHPVTSSDSAHAMVRLLLRSSTNGGRTWSILPTPKAAHVRPANVMGSGWLLRLNQTSAYLASSPAPRDVESGHSTPLWLTTNSGVSWSRRTIPCSSFNANMALSVAQNGTMFDVCAGEPSAGNQLKETVRSTNEGRTWQIRSTCRFSPSNALRCTPGSQFSGYLGQIDAISNSDLYLVGDRSSLMVSRNGGTTWSVVPPGLGGDAGGTSQVIFFGSSSGIVLGDNDHNNERPTLWSTTDGGAHWTARVPHFN